MELVAGEDDYDGFCLAAVPCKKRRMDAKPTQKSKPVADNDDAVSLLGSPLPRLEHGEPLYKPLVAQESLLHPLEDASQLPTWTRLWALEPVPPATHTRYVPGMEDVFGVGFGGDGVQLSSSFSLPLHLPVLQQPKPLYTGARNPAGHPHGQGTSCSPDGEPEYAGEWKNGLRHGYGTSFTGGRIAYAGDWREGVRSGKGVLYHPNGTLHVWGAFVDGFSHGPGIMEFDQQHRLQFEGSHARGGRSTGVSYHYPDDVARDWSICYQGGFDPATGTYSGEGELHSWQRRLAGAPIRLGSGERHSLTLFKLGRVGPLWALLVNHAL